MNLLRNRSFAPIVVLSLLLLTSWSCKSGDQKQQKQQTVTTELSLEGQNLFNVDSAYEYVAKQLSFGSRVPNTAEHAACAAWLVSHLEQMGLDVQTQKATVKTGAGKDLPITNIIASLNPEATQRILLLAHWDTRPIADQDPTPSLQNKPILGADDGGSGVAVLLELARILKPQNLPYGIDFLLVDAEDMGNSEENDSWCLGSTYWSKNPHKAEYRAVFGILFDMVGARGAKFRWELYSLQSAPHLLSTLWSHAAQLGYGNYFVQAEGGGLIDDHIAIIKNRNIPTIDIVNYDPSRSNGFGEHWHTHGDNLDIIDKATLQAVGETVTTFLMNLNANLQLQ